MRRLALLGLAPVLVAMTAVAVTTSAGAVAPHPFSPKGNSAAVREEIEARFPGALFPTREGKLCSPGEHSPDGPASYCFAEFKTGATWNVVEASVTLNLIGESSSAVRIYGHKTWHRRWKRCPLPRTPGRLFSNDDCGAGQPEGSLAQSDEELIEFEALPRIRAGKPIRAITRDFIFADAVPWLSRYRASKQRDAFVFANAVGDVLRYRPARSSAGGRTPTMAR